jgi:hypothetical protein
VSARSICRKEQQDIISLARAWGSNPRDFRDAVHELSHTIDYGCESMDREEIHAHIIADEPQARIDTELRARAAEWLACELAGIDYDVEYWAFVAFMEASKSGVWLPRPVSDAIASHRDQEGADALESIRALARGEAAR